MYCGPSRRLADCVPRFVLTGWLAGGERGVWGAVIPALGAAVALRLGGGRAVRRMLEARPLPIEEAPRAYLALKRAVAAAGVRAPRLFVIAEEAPNAFVSGDRAIGVTEGLLRALDSQELEAVLAQQLAHLRRGDAVAMTTGAALGGALRRIADFALWGAALGPAREERQRHRIGRAIDRVFAVLAAPLVRLTVSGQMRLDADAEAARTSGNPLALASALRKMQAAGERTPVEAAVRETAHLFVVMPLPAESLPALLRTHPPVALRLARLEAMAAGVPIAA